MAVLSRELRAVDGGDPAAVLSALRSALDGSGSAVRVAPSGTATGPGAEPGNDVIDEAIALVVETSGSSGEPKRVGLSAAALLASAAATEVALGGPGRWLLCLPLHYVAGLQVLVRSLAAGTEPLVLPAGHFDATAFVALAERLDAGPGSRRYTAVVPVQLARLVALAETDARAAAVLRGFDGILVGGQATAAPLAERAERLGLRIRRTYGASETAGGCVYDGVPIGAAEVRIVDPTPSGLGSVELTGPVLAEGYLRADYTLDAERTAAVFPSAGGRRYRTGDLGRLVDGVLSIEGRADSVIISGGEKVSLDAVERAARDAGFGDVVVVRLPHDEWGEVPAVATTDASASLDGIAAAVVARLGRAAAPRRLLLFDELPLLASGKPDRRSIERAAAAAE